MDGGAGKPQSMLVSGIQQSDLVIHTHIFTLFQIFSHTDYHKMLCRGLCSVQQVLVGYVSYDIK